MKWKGKWIPRFLALTGYLFGCLYGNGQLSTYCSAQESASDMMALFGFSYLKLGAIWVDVRDALKDLHLTNSESEPQINHWPL